MSEPRNNLPAEADEDDTVSQLLRLAGARSSIPADFREQIRLATETAWEEKVQARATRLDSDRQKHRWLAVAAVLITALGAAVVWRSFSSGASAREVARIAGVFCDQPSFEKGSPINAGQVFDSGSCRLALTLAGGHELRLDRGTRLKVESERLLDLTAGAVYLDSGRSRPEDGVVVTTTWGTARDIGTQFEVRLENGGLRLQVREGEVQLQSANDELHRVVSGSALVVSREGATRLEPVASYGDSWWWLLSAAPEYELEGRTLRAFLEWLSRETGWQIRFADPELENAVTTIITHGSLGALTPDQTPALVLPPAGLGHRLENGVLTIERAAGRP